MISENTIREVKESVVTHEIVGSLIPIKKKGADYVGLCPFHNEKTPSFSVSPSKNIYKCFGCGASGDGITFLIEHQKMTFIEAIKWIADKNNIHIQETGVSKQVYKPTPRLEKLSKETIRYFEEHRKISNNTLLRFKITESVEWMPKAQAEVNAICFNYYIDEELINIKFRAKNKDFKMSKGSELIFYNLDSIKDEETVYITEGEIDCMSLAECGVYNVVSVPNGAAVSGTQRLEYLDNCYHHFTSKKKIVLLTDNDKAGLKLRDELARRLGYDKCWIVSYVDGCKDANDVLVKHGKEALLSIIEEAKLYPLEGEITMDDMYTSIVDFYENGYPEGYTSGISNDFDKLLKFYPGQLTIVTGIPGSGKSEFIDWIMASLVKNHKWNWGVCSFECEPEFHVTKLAEKFTNKAFAFRKDQDKRITPQELEYSIGMIDKHFHFMNLSLIDVTIDGLIAKAEEFVLRYGINGFLFDPWNCIEAKGEGTDYILQCLNKLINFLGKYKVHGFLVAHPTKLQKDKGTGKYEIPTLYSISGSAHFFNRTHNGLCVYRDFQTNVVDVYVQKVKHYWLGKIGSCGFTFNTETRMYNPLLTMTETNPNQYNDDNPF